MDGGSIGGTLLVIFIILKLTHTISWSWLWVLSPLWIDVGASLLILGTLAIFGISVTGLIKRSFRRGF